MIPYLSPERRAEFTRLYTKILGSSTPDDAIINEDRKRLKKLISHPLWQNKAQK